jgi:large subunit ribosomal protein L19
VRRAKLYYLRGRTGKRARIQEKRDDRARAAKVADRPEPRETHEATETPEAAE